MHNGAALAVCPLPRKGKGQTEFAACADPNPPNATIPTAHRDSKGPMTDKSPKTKAELEAFVLVQLRGYRVGADGDIPAGSV